MNKRYLLDTNVIYYLASGRVTIKVAPGCSIFIAPYTIVELLTSSKRLSDRIAAARQLLRVIDQMSASILEDTEYVLAKHFGLDLPQITNRFTTDIFLPVLRLFANSPELLVTPSQVENAIAGMKNLFEERKREWVIKMQNTQNKIGYLLKSHFKGFNKHKVTSVMLNDIKAQIISRSVQTLLSNIEKEYNIHLNKKSYIMPPSLYRYVDIFVEYAIHNVLSDRHPRPNDFVDIELVKYATIRIDSIITSDKMMSYLSRESRHPELVSLIELYSPKKDAQ